MTALANVDILNARLPHRKSLSRIAIDGAGKIAEIAPMQAASSSLGVACLDVAGDWVSLGGIDLQINGALGLPFPDLTPDHRLILQKINQFLWRQGVDAYLPTLVTTSVAKIQQSLAAIAEFMAAQAEPQWGQAQILGVHLEGPFLNRDKRGAHPAEYLLPLNLETIRQVLGDYGSIVKIMTLAPELEPTGAAIAYLRSQGIGVSLGHSLATAEEAARAFEQGATLVTHAFNAMPPLHHRQPGLLGAAIANTQVYCGLIADGQHVTPLMMQILLRASQFEQGIFLVSDALAPLGLADGVYPWDSREIEVKNGTARLLAGTLAGTTLPLLVGVENLVNWGLCTPEQGILMATETPRTAIALPGLMPGLPATLLRWRWEDSLRWERLSKV